MATPCTLRRVCLRLPRLLLLTLLLAGCNNFSIRRTQKAPDVYASWRVSASLGDTLSARSLQTLRRWDLENLYLENPREALARLQPIAEKEGHPDLLFALSEMTYLLGCQSEKSACCASIGYFYLSAGYAYHYLFGAHAPRCPGQPGTARDPKLLPVDFEGNVSPFDPRFRLACDLYNASLTRCIRAAQRVGRLDPRQTLHLPTCDGRGFTLSVVHEGFLWKPEEFGYLLFCEDYQSNGLANHHRTYGLGVPLIATRSPTAPNPPHAHYPPNVSFPVTAFFRFEGTLAQLRQQQAGRLELYNPIEIQTVRVEGRRAPLETDLTTPLTYFLAQTNLEQLGYTGFLRPDRVLDRSGIYLVEPYQPGKIPVVFVHGLLSSPVTWATMFNDLRADPAIRSRYQFWFVFYPTANPYLNSAADLRDELAQLRQDLDAEKKDPALDQMVFVGHSMGGLVSKLLTVEGGPDFWALLSQESPDQIKGRPEDKAKLQRVFYFERQNYVKRVVFLGTPHHGSKLSPSWPARLAKRFVRVPRQLMDVAEDLATNNPNAFPGWRPERLPTSIDLLAPKSPALELLASKPKPPEVHYHSIIGMKPPTHSLVLANFIAGVERCEPGDGVVPYSSAHIENADSELVVPAEHTEVHTHPLAVREVRRILLEHVRQVRDGNLVR